MSATDIFLHRKIGQSMVHLARSKSAMKANTALREAFIPPKRPL